MRQASVNLKTTLIHGNNFFSSDIKIRNAIKTLHLNHKITKSLGNLMSKLKAHTNIVIFCNTIMQLIDIVQHCRAHYRSCQIFSFRNV